MRFGFWRVFIGSFLLLSCLAGIPYLWVTSEVQKDEFKALAEKKASEFLSAHVEIDRIRVGMINRVALSGLRIRSQAKDDDAYRIHVDQIVFRYHPLAFLSRKLSVPSGIILQAPKLLVKQTEFSYDLLKDFKFGTGAESVSSLEFKGGEIFISVPGFRSNIHVQNINGVLRPQMNGEIRVNLKGHLKGLLNGEAKLRGIVAPFERRHDLDLELDSVSLNDELSIPLKDMKGKIRWVNQEFYFDGVQASVYGWDTLIKGELKNLRTAPVLAFSWSAGKKYPALMLTFLADFSNEYVEGSLQWLKEDKHVFRGNIKREKWNFIFNDVLVDDQYSGSGHLDVESGYSRFQFQRGAQRFAAQTNLRDLNFHLAFNLEHAKIYGLDFVTSAEIELKPTRSWEEGRLWSFDGLFRTDYFVLEYAPFSDLQGRFQINSFGVHDIFCSWGHAFEMNGDISFTSKRPEGKFVLQVNGFDLAGVKNFASKPLPKTLGGYLEGKLKMEGVLSKPEISGSFSVKDGVLGKLEYDRGMIHFHGFAPYLPLEDSRILRGRTELYLRGALDLSLANMFHGIRIETADHFVLWKGWEFTTSDTEGDLEIDHIISRLPKIAVKAGLTTGGATLGDTDNMQQDEGYVAIGPKVRF